MINPKVIAITTVRELTTEGKFQAAKPAAARDNVRFADKRIADLEVQLVEQHQDLAMPQRVAAGVTVLAHRAVQGTGVTT